MTNSAQDEPKTADVVVFSLPEFLSVEQDVAAAHH